MVAGSGDTVMAGALAVELCGIPLRTPLIPAAGTLGKEALDGSEEVYGAMLPKTVTPGPRAGNPPPRLAEAPSGMINSIGLQNPGLDAFLKDLDAFHAVGLPLFVSVAGDTVAEFASTCGALASDGRVSAVELNLSCPNVEHGGGTFCAGPSTVGEVVAASREALGGAKPLLVKLANDGVTSNAVAAEDAGADAVTVINTLPRSSWTRGRGASSCAGALGPAIKPVALRAVYEVSRAVRIPVVGCGG
ncbi:dihydroorotate dehydrogenase [Rubrobacter marinus]|uniref:Dihydroorotate dehydrogenase n=1 Tax=Rubrobacter marinus TaxID=2653852 RepID=A0A6G8PXI5_9ACTN|nr:dihydroorotate dehydrogenase [Rubrobacter marinus]QIN78847.1 dihydroorotate dehydrogenase [Rubrobacter marinus]